jgi:hypothetical protein
MIYLLREMRDISIAIREFSNLSSIQNSICFIFFLWLKISLPFWAAALLVFISSENHPLPLKYEINIVGDSGFWEE